MPRGRSPTLIDLTAPRFATSTTSTVAPSSALTYSHLPSGLNTACSGFCPLTLTLVASRGAAARISETLLFSSTATAIHAPSREIPTPSGDFPTGIRCDIHDHERAARLVAHVQAPAVGSRGDAARLAVRLDGGHHPVARRVDHRHGPRSLVGDIGEGRRTRLRHARKRENQGGESSKCHSESEARGSGRNCRAFRYHPAGSNPCERHESLLARRGSGPARVGTQGRGAVRGPFASLAHDRQRPFLGALRRAHPCAGPDRGGSRRIRLSPRHRLAEVAAGVAYADRGARFARFFERVRLAVPVQLHRHHSVASRRRRAAAEPRA